MEEQSAFTKRHIEEVTTAKQTLLEEMNLPPAVIAYMRANRVMLWALFFAIIAGICGYRYYNFYSVQLKDNAAMALVKAMAIQDDTLRAPALQKVVEEYGSTGAATWSKIELSRDLARVGQYDKALVFLDEAFTGITNDDPSYPLFVSYLGQLNEQKGDFGQALSWYEKLLTTPGFHSFGYIASARVYEKMDNNVKAKEMYENANTDTSLQPEMKSWLDAKIAIL